MTDQRIVARKIASFAAPTADELSYFESLSPSEQRSLVQAEIEKGFVGEFSGRSLDDIVARARAQAKARRRADD
jgi:hypothetical protein